MRCRCYKLRASISHEVKVVLKAEVVSYLSSLNACVFLYIIEYNLSTNRLFKGTYNMLK